MQTGVYAGYPLTSGNFSDHCPRILVEHPTQGLIYVYGDTGYVNHYTPGCLKTTGSLYGHGGDVTFQFEDGGGNDFDIYMELKWNTTSVEIYISAKYHIYPIRYFYGSYEMRYIPAYPAYAHYTVPLSKCFDNLKKQK